MAAIDVKVAKAALRASLRQQMIALSSDDRQRQSDWLFNALSGHPSFVAANKIACFANMPHEVPTSRIIQLAFSLHKRVFLPVVTSATVMRLVEATDWDDVLTWPRSRWGIPEPPIESLPRRADAAVCGVDLVLVPGLAFTSEGHRLGQGKGFYDRWLSAQHPCPNTIGLGWGVQLVAPGSIPIEPADVPLSEVLTPPLAC